LTDVRFKVNSPPVIHQTLDGEVIVVNLDTGTYYSFDGVAAEIWAAAERGLTVDEVVSEAAERQGASSTTAAPAVTRFLAELASEELIVGVNGSAPFTAAEKEISSSHPAFPEPRLNKYTDMQELLLLDPIHDVDERGWPNAAAAGQDTTGS
jgi:hypothetical protein